MLVSVLEQPCNAQCVPLQHFPIFTPSAFSSALRHSRVLTCGACSLFSKNGYAICKDLVDYGDFLK